MRVSVLFALLGLLASLHVATAPGALAQEPEKLELPVVPGTLAVLMTYPDGSPGTVFNSSNPLVFDINFNLALSSTGTYPLRFTLIQDDGGGPEETVIWSGTLEEGYYRLRYPLDHMPSGGEVHAKIIMRVRMFVKNFTGKSSYQYYNWEDTYGVGKIR
jgi:hypothetical protein